MSSAFSELIASIGKPQTQSGEAANKLKPTPAARPTSGLVPNNAAAGVKRKPDGARDAPQAKATKTEQPAAAPKTIAPSNRFQLSARGGSTQKPVAPANRPATTQATAAKPTHPKSPQKPTASSSAAAGSNANAGAPPKRGFASIMAKAKAAQEAAKAAGPNTIKHKPVEKLSRRERARLMEERKAQQKGAGKGDKSAGAPVAAADRSRSGTPVAAGQKKKGAELSYKGTMRKPTVERQPLAYKGTMRSVDPAAAREKEKEKKKRMGEDKYGGYANWSDLSDAEDEEEEDYESDASSDMEGGFDDMEQEEMSALRAAKKEDQEALEEEERHKREKLERKRKLQQLSKSAAAKKKV